MGLGHSGPWNIAVHLRGTESLLMDTYDDPAFVHELMKFSTEVVRTVGDALIEAGFSPSLGEAAASCSLISPEIYRNFIKPYHQELCQYFNSRKALMALHVCGYIDPIVADIVETGVSLLSLDAPSSLENLIDLSAAQLIVMGNVPTVLFSSGTREEMEHAIRDCIKKAAESSGYILSSGCEIPLNSTQDRIEHYFHYARQYGRQFMLSLKERKPELFMH
jgi:uroporphyrinogen decarboxylase